MTTAVESPRAAPEGRFTEEELLSAVPRRSMNREVRVGLFVLVGLAAFFAALFTFTDVGTFRGRYYTTTVVDDAGGMRRGDPVQMRGVNIGRVVGFEMVPQGVAVRLELSNEYPVPEDSHVLVKPSGLLGGMVVDVVPGRSAERVDDGAALPGLASGGIMSTAEGLGTQADAVLGQLNAMLSQQTVGAVNQSAVELQTLLTDLGALAAQQRQELAALSSSLRRSATGVERATAGPELARTVANLDALTARLDETTRTLNQASGSLDLVLGRMARGEGTLGRLSADETLYTNLNTAVAGINTLVEDIRLNPKKYFEVKVF